jgi:DNA sulfur modification protein DndD
MILDELTITNFGTYRGRQKLVLTPPSPNQPIVLIGALNGGGKTTLLDALHLVLYGKRANVSNRGELAYDEYLRRAIHRSVPASEGAVVELQFRHWSEGQEQTYKIRRSWHDTGRSVPEQLEVLRDGVHDRVLTDSWNEAVEEFIPQGIARLFLFDGEKIESLAEPKTAREVFATAVNSLLGLDVLQQLANDLIVLERKRRAAEATGSRRAAILALENEVKDQELRVERLLQDRAALQSSLQQKRQRLAEAEELLRRAGGDLYAQRAYIEAEQGRAQQALAATETELRALAEGPLVFQLVPDLLAEVVEQGEAELQAQRAEVLLEELEQRDAALLAAAAACETPATILDALAAHLQSDRHRRADMTKRRPSLGLEAEAVRAAQSLVETVLPTELARTKALLERHDSLKSELFDIDRRLAQIPDEGAIAALTAERTARRAQVAELQAKELLAAESLEQARVELERLRSQLSHLIETSVHEEFEREAAGRTVMHSRKVRETLDRFRAALLEKHLTRLGRLVTESYQRLIRKQSFVGEVRIDPETFGLQLIGSNGEALPTERLSAGERQLLAVSMLWGLARASGRPLPAVIDTPLGRLDSVHRTLLIERYFPHASHQVLILSTDEEIDETYYPLLAPRVGRAYHLRYDEVERHTVVQHGYFW